MRVWRGEGKGRGGGGEGGACVSHKHTQTHIQMVPMTNTTATGSRQAGSDAAAWTPQWPSRVRGQTHIQSITTGVAEGVGRPERQESTQPGGAGVDIHTNTQRTGGCWFMYDDHDDHDDGEEEQAGLLQQPGLGRHAGDKTTGIVKSRRHRQARLHAPASCRWD